MLHPERNFDHIAVRISNRDPNQPSIAATSVADLVDACIRAPCCANQKRPLRVVAPYAPGATPDVLARLLGGEIAQLVNQSAPDVAIYAATQKAMLNANNIEGVRRLAFVAHLAAPEENGRSIPSVKPFSDLSLTRSISGLNSEMDAKECGLANLWLKLG